MKSTTRYSTVVVVVAGGAEELQVQHRQNRGWKLVAVVVVVVWRTFLDREGTDPVVEVGSLLLLLLE